jgi:hypothetical protein
MREEINSEEIRLQSKVIPLLRSAYSKLAFYNSRAPLEDKGSYLQQRAIGYTGYIPYRCDIVDP